VTTGPSRVVGVEGAVPSGMGRAPATGLTATGRRLVLGITALSVAHHVDHVLRDNTGWPLQEGFNPFSASLFVYPVIAAGLILSARQRVGPRFWALLAGGAAVFIAAVHVGPAAGDSVGDIPDQYGSPAAAAVALAVLALFVAGLLVHCVHEVRRIHRPGR
jgi:hypothetical protein